MALRREDKSVLKELSLELGGVLRVVRTGTELQLQKRNPRTRGWFVLLLVLLPTA